MTRNELLALARQALTLPTAPYHEHAVRDFVIAHCRELGLRVESDRAGNVIARWQGSKSMSKGKSKSERERVTAPLVFVAHMDHPGFEALSGNRAEFLGGVPKELFRGARVRFYGKDGVVRATIGGLNQKAWPKRKLVYLRAESRKLKADSRPRAGDFGMWELPAFRLRDEKLHAVAIDDVLSVVVVLATLMEVVRRKLRTQVWGVFTRAEEVGFHGAIELAKAGRIPRNALVISMEMSSRRPWARIGHGPVVRMGDRMTTFDLEATFFLQGSGEVASGARSVVSLAARSHGRR